MSSTNRGSKRRADDNYQTPAWSTQRLAELGGYPLKPGRYLDPCAGSGAIIRALPGVEWWAQELRYECRDSLIDAVGDPERVRIGSFLNQRHQCDFDVIITNPPYSMAQEIIQRSLQFRCRVVMLLRLNYLASAKRAAFMSFGTPDVFVLPNRPSFTGGKTDSCEYAWFVWDRQLHGERREGRIKILATTSIHDRRTESIDESG